MSALAVFTFQELHEVRIVVLDGEPWFVAKDVCNALTIQNPTDALKALDDDERSRFNLGRQGQANIINESGLFTLILRSRDAVNKGTQAWRFRKWITGEVLPSIRKTGSYQPGFAPTQNPRPTPRDKQEPLTWELKSELEGIVAHISSQFWFKRCCRSGIWHALRRATNNPSPTPFTVDDLPAITRELRRILAAIEPALGFNRAFEQEFLRRVVRKAETKGVFELIPDSLPEVETTMPAVLAIALEKLETGQLIAHDNHLKGVEN
jgi:prophage antirepressor-like protein